MRLEIEIPDGQTLAAFKNMRPPDGVRMQLHIPPEAQQNALDVHFTISVTLDVARTIQTIVVARMILSAFRHYA